MSVKRSVLRAAAALAVAGVAGTAMIATPAQAAAPAMTTTLAAATTSSTVGGSITRNEIIERAKYWLGKNLTYNQGGSYPDSDGKSYRTDCSGYVSMAWHLGSSLNTVGIANSSDTYEISRSQLKAGDVLNSYYDHVILFDKWDDAAKTKFSYYSFG
ncbi:VCBS repeat-containing protein, partial [Streptomyces sp. NPDC058872]